MANIGKLKILFEYLRLFQNGIWIYGFKFIYALWSYDIMECVLSLTNFGGYIFNFELLVTFYDQLHDFIIIKLWLIKKR